MTTTVEEKDIDLSSCGYQGYCELISECELPKTIKESLLKFACSLDHYVFCAKRYSKRTCDDEISKLHCHEVWNLIESETDFLKVVSFCMRNLLGICPSETNLLKTKLVYKYLIALTKQC